MSIDEFLRQNGPFIETAVRQYIRGKQLIKLVASIHIGERDYYESLAQELAYCEKVLYEGISEEEIPLRYRLFSFVPWFSGQLHESYELDAKILGVSTQIKTLKPEENWECPDATMAEILKEVGILSKVNFNTALNLIQLYKLLRTVKKYEKLGDKDFIKYYCQGIYESILGPEIKSKLFEATNEFRESKLKEKIETFSQSGCLSTGVLYGSDHMQHIEDFITNQLSYKPSNDVKWKRAFMMK